MSGEDRLEEADPSDPEATWTRPQGAYMRPERVRTVIGEQETHAVGCYAYPEGYLRLGVGEDVTVELVPEPGNPHDPNAVALEVNEQRVGYLSRTMASVWSPVVLELNAAGQRVETPGTVVSLAYDYVGAAHDLGVVVRLPYRSAVTLWRAVAGRGFELGASWSRVAIHRDQFSETHARLLDGAPELAAPVVLRPGEDTSYKRPRPCLDVLLAEELVAVVPSGRTDYDDLVGHLDDPTLVPLIYLRDMSGGEALVQLWLNDDPPPLARHAGQDAPEPRP